MKLKKLVAQVQDYLDADERKRKEKKKYIKSVLDRKSVVVGKCGVGGGGGGW